MQYDKSAHVRLRIARYVMGYTSIKSFTSQFGLRYHTYSKHELGDNVISYETLFRYAEYLNISPCWLLTGEGHPCPLLPDGEKKKKEIEMRLAEMNLLKIAGFLPLHKLNTAVLINFAQFERIFRAIYIKQQNIPPNECLNVTIEIYNQWIRNPTAPLDKLLSKLLLPLQIE